MTQNVLETFPSWLYRSQAPNLLPSNSFTKPRVLRKLFPPSHKPRTQNSMCCTSDNNISNQFKPLQQGAALSLIWCL